MSIIRSNSQPPQASICSCKPAHLVHQLVEIVVRLRIGHAAGDFVEAVDQILDRLHGREQVLADRLVEVQLRLLGHIADAHALGQAGRAVEVLVDAGHDPQQRRFARPVFADHADLGPVEERQTDVAQHDLLAERFRDVAHFEDELWGHRRLGVSGIGGSTRRAFALEHRQGADRPIATGS